MKHTQNKIAPYTVCRVKKEFKSKIMFTFKKRKIDNLPTHNIVPKQMFIIWNFIAFF